MIIVEAQFLISVNKDGIRGFPVNKKPQTQGYSVKDNLFEKRMVIKIWII